MWNDWSALVRQAAAQALGKLGLGSDIHNELRYQTLGTEKTCIATDYCIPTMLDVGFICFKI